jgi:hypothetical protein
VRSSLRVPQPTQLLRLKKRSSLLVLSPFKLVSPREEALALYSIQEQPPLTQSLFTMDMPWPKIQSNSTLVTHLNKGGEYVDDFILKHLQSDLNTPLNTHKNIQNTQIKQHFTLMAARDIKETIYKPELND